MMTVKAASLVLDYNLYPRHKIDRTHVLHIRAVMRAGVPLPPVVADKASRRVSDGFHRVTAALAEDADDAEIQVFLKDYASEADMLLDAILMNSGHGANLTPYDRVRCVVLAGEYDIAPEQIARALRTSPDELESLRLTRTATVGRGAQITPIKQGLGHLARRGKITRRQADGNADYGGLQPTYYVNEVIRILDYDLADWDNPRFVARLLVLREKLTALDLRVETPA